MEVLVDGREFERLAQRNKNWARTGFGSAQAKPEATKPVEPKPVEPKPLEPKPLEPKPLEPKPVEPKPLEPKPLEPKPVEPKPVEPKPVAAPPIVGVTAIKIDGRLFSVRSPSEFDGDEARLKMELLEFMFSAYGRYGLLPVSGLAEFVERNELKPYLVHKARLSWPKGTEYLSNGPFFN